MKSTRTSQRHLRSTSLLLQLLPLALLLSHGSPAFARARDLLQDEIAEERDALVATDAAELHPRGYVPEVGGSLLGGAAASRSEEALPSALVEELSSEGPQLSRESQDELINEEITEAVDEIKSELKEGAKEASEDAGEVELIAGENAEESATEELSEKEESSPAAELGEVSEKDTGFWAGFIRSFLVIIVIEIGDRTFFIAALMGIKHNQIKVFLGAFSALAFMTVVSTALGVVAPLLLPRWFTHYAATILFGFFGGQLLWKAYNMTNTGASEELEEVEEELAAKGDVSSHGPMWKQFLYSIYVQAFTMTAIAEWGDRSQIATIAMAADYNPYGITIGGSLGHGCATAFAVVSGRAIASKISEKMITYSGGFVFMLFAVLAFFEDPDEDMSKSIPSWMTSWAS